MGYMLMVVLVAVSLNLKAAELSTAEIHLESLGYQFYSKTLQVEWKFPAQQLPKTARTFEVVPANFSDAIVTNLVNWGGFTE